VVAVSQPNDGKKIS